MSTPPVIRLRFSPTTPKLKARVYPGIPPLQAEFRNNGTAIQWRVGASGTWTDLVDLIDIAGPVSGIIAGTGIAVDSSDLSHPIIALSPANVVRDYLDTTPYVATRTALKALVTAKDTAAYLTEAGREGTFVFMAGDYSTQVTADTLEGIYIKADDTASSAGAWVRIYANSLSVKWFGAKGDTTTDDKLAIQAALDVLKATGGGVLFLPRGGYKVTGGLTYDLSAENTRFGSRLHIKGEGAAVSYISMTGVAATLLSYTGIATNPEAYVRFEGLRLTGDQTSTSKGLAVSIAAYLSTEDFVIEIFDYNMDLTDVEQAQFSNSNFRFGKHGVRANAGVSTTAFNTVNFFNCAIANNAIWGAEFTNPNAVQFIGGSIQYNGTVGGGSTQWGIKTIDVGNGYGTVNFIGVALEGNGGLGDHVSSQSTYVATHNYIGCGFARPNSSFYATNFIACLGSTASIYNIAGNTFRGYSTYTPNAARPYFALTNTAALFFDDGTNVYGSATEQPAWAGMARTHATQTPAANDGAALGTSSLSWSDLFLASGGVINFNAGDVTITHTTDKLSFAGAASGWFFGNSVVVGAGGTAIGTFTTHVTTDQNFYVGGAFNLADGVSFGSINDANNTLLSQEFRGSQMVFSPGGTALVAVTTTGFGYRTNAGGAVTQITSKSTGVTLNKVCGQITMRAAALAAAAKVSFVVTNSTIAATDGVQVWVASGGTANAYRANLTAVAAGSFTVTVENITAGPLSEAPVIGFAVLKAVTA